MNFRTGLFLSLFVSSTIIANSMPGSGGSGSGSGGSSVSGTGSYKISCHFLWKGGHNAARIEYKYFDQHLGCRMKIQCDLRESHLEFEDKNGCSSLSADAQKRLDDFKEMARRFCLPNQFNGPTITETLNHPDAKTEDACDNLSKEDQQEFAKDYCSQWTEDSEFHPVETEWGLGASITLPCGSSQPQCTSAP